MKVLVLGATGRTGKWVVPAALAAGHEVHCLARNSNRISPQAGLTVFEGNPTDPQDLKNALNGCQALINVLNISRRSDFPWAPLRTPKTFLSEVMQNILSVSATTPLQRIVLCAAWGVAETKQDLPGWFRWFIDNSNIGVAYRDHERQEELLAASRLDWTIVRPVGLTNGKLRAVKSIEGRAGKPGLLISRESLAQFLVDALGNDELMGKKVVVSKD